MQDFYEKYGEWALVTGASSGIGLEFAKQTAAKGLNVVLVARRKGRLEKIAKQIEAANSVQTRIVVADLTEAAGISAVIEETQLPVSMKFDIHSNSCIMWFFPFFGFEPISN